MSFKILSDEEKSFLDEESLRIYNEEYELYLERNRFVDRLEALENVKIDEYEPELKKIRPIGTVRETKFDFSKPERPDVRNDIEIKEHSELPHGFDFPQFSVHGNNIKIAEVPELKNEIQTDFFLSDIPETKDFHVEPVYFKMPGTGSIEVDTDVVPEFNEVNYETPEYTISGTENIKRNYEITLHSFKGPEISSPVLDTDVAVSPAVTEFTLPEHSAADIEQPKINCNIEVRDFTVPEFSAKVPSMEIVQKVNISHFEAEKPEISKLPKLNVCHVSIPEHRPVKAEAGAIPNIKVDQVKKHDGFVIDRPEIELPEVSIDDFAGSDFEMPGIEKISLNTAVDEKPFFTENVKMPKHDLEIKMPCVSSADDIESGIKAFSEKFNNSLTSLKNQTSATDTNSLKQKEAEIP